MGDDLRAELQDFLQKLNIRTSCVEHPPVRTRPKSTEPRYIFCVFNVNLREINPVNGLQLK